MCMPSYWRGVLGARTSRRRAMAGTGAGALGAAILAACGGSSGNKSGSSGPQDKSGLLAKVNETTKQAKPGGTFVNALTADPLGLDPYQVTTGPAHAPY